MLIMDMFKLPHNVCMASKVYAKMELKDEMCFPGNFVMSLQIHISKHVL